MSWILYSSHPTAPPWPASILDIAKSCEKNNPENGVNGLILFTGNMYLHYLEGNATTLSNLWKNVQSDPRHTIEWKTGGDDAPELTGLPMGYFDADREKSEHLPVETWRKRETWAPSDAFELRKMLISLAREKYPSALGIA